MSMLTDDYINFMEELDSYGRELKDLLFGKPKSYEYSPCIRIVCDDENMSDDKSAPDKGKSRKGKQHRGKSRENKHN